MSSIPPASNQIRKQNSQQGRVYQNNIFSIAISNNKLWQSDTNTKALLAVRVAKLDEVISDFLVGKGFVGFYKFDIVVVYGFECFVFRRVWSGLIRMVFLRKLLIV